MKVLPFFVEFFRLLVNLCNCISLEKYLSKIILLSRFRGYIYNSYQTREILIVAIAIDKIERKHRPNNLNLALFKLARINLFMAWFVALRQRHMASLFVFKQVPASLEAWS